jgi:hypothetical protein
VQSKRRDKGQAGTPPHSDCCAISQPPLSHDLAPSDVWLFPALKMGLKGKRFATAEDTKFNEKGELQKIKKEAFLRCFQQ